MQMCLLPSAVQGVSEYDLSIVMWYLVWERDVGPKLMASPLWMLSVFLGFSMVLPGDLSYNRMLKYACRRIPTFVTDVHPAYKADVGREHHSGGGRVYVLQTAGHAAID
jgi:hypothetical protein